MRLHGPLHPPPALAGELDDQYEVLLDEPPAQYSYMWDEELQVWRLICREASTITLDPDTPNPLQVTIHRRVVLN